MAGVARLAFRYEGRPSPARAWDIRFRVAATALFSAGLLAAPAPALAPLGLGVAGLLALARSTAGEAARVVRGFSGFLLFFFVLGMVAEPTGAQAGFLAVQALRLTLVLLLGHFLFLAATPGAVTEGIRWYLGWLGPRRAWLAASMAGWALASVPLILDQAAGIREAAAVRGLAARRHPLQLLKLLTVALLVRAVGRSLELAEALETRGFGRSVPGSTLKARPRDAVLFGAVAAGVAASWAFGAIFTP